MGVGVTNGVGVGVGVADGVGVGIGIGVGVGVGVGVDGVTEGGVGVVGVVGATYCAITIVMDVDVVTPKASVIVTSTLVVPNPDDVPEITPVLELSVNPAGSEPAVSA